ncbi:MAG: chromate transporter [Desulfobacterales bacterium]
MENAKINTPAVGGGRNQISDDVFVNHPSFGEAFRFWLKLGFISFGGPAGQISIMYQELVDKKRWVSNERFLNALNYCMLLPGPEAQQLAVYIGWLLHKIPGGIVAGLLFLLPSMFILFALSYTYAALGDISWIAALFGGLKAAVMAIVVTAVIKIGRKALKNAVMVMLAAASFIAIQWGGMSIITVIMVAGGLGMINGIFIN